MSIGVAPPNSPLPSSGQARAGFGDLADGAGQGLGAIPEALLPDPLVAPEMPPVSGDVSSNVSHPEDSGESENVPSGSPWLTPAEREAWLALSTIMFKLPGLLDQQLQRDSDLSFFEYMVLAVLAEQSPPRLRMSQLSALTNGSLSRLSHVAKRLESKKYIVRRTDAIDRRSTNAILTSAGLAKVRDTSPGHVAWVRHLVFDNITPAQVSQLTEIVSRVRPDLDPDNEFIAR